MSAHLDHELEPRTERRFDRHIAGCRLCARVLDSLRRTIGLLRETGEEPPLITRSVTAHVLARIAEPASNESGGGR